MLDHTKHHCVCVKLALNKSVGLNRYTECPCLSLLNAVASVLRPILVQIYFLVVSFGL